MSEHLAVEPPDLFVLPEERPFWDAIAEDRFVLVTCDDCGARSAIARSCVRCGSERYHWDEATAAGTVRSLVFFHRAYHKYFEDRLPYCVVLVALADGPELLMNMCDAEGVHVSIGMPVKLVSRPVGASVILNAVPA
jgi:uncharacterized OB-fold protein